MNSILDYEGLVYSIINKYPRSFDRDDLFQVGMIGLIDAFNHYDSKRETKFSTFAYYYIIGKINQFIRENQTLKISKNLIDLKKSILNAKEIICQNIGREPTILELSLYLDESEESISSAIVLTEGVESIDNSYDKLKYFDSLSADILDLRREIKNLPEQEKNLILARYYNELTQKETSDLLGISQVQVSRYENKILQKLRQRL